MPSPRELGFRLPPEWAPHTRCWMAWPCRPEAFGGRLAEARAAFAEVAASLAAFEPVSMIVRPDLVASASLELGSGISILPMPHDDSWMRDVAPMFLVHESGALAALCFRFNAWGELYEPFAQDAQIARRLGEHLGLPLFESELVLEGGAMVVDGEGTALLCEPSVLDPARNPGVERQDVERELRDLLGIERVIWLPHGLIDDETKGHVDNVARFVRPGVVVAAVDRESGANRERLEANLEVLRKSRDARERELEIVPLPLPQPRTRHDGRLLTTSYVNFYLANRAVLVPAFDDPQDAVAYKTRAGLFPDRKVVQIESLEIVQGGGGLHCITREQPRP